MSRYKNNYFLLLYNLLCLLLGEIKRKLENRGKWTCCLIMDVILGDENSNPIEQELAITISGFASRIDTEASYNNRGNSLQEKKKSEILLL